jgi:hypothetical protein
MMAISYKDARAEIMRAMQVVKAMIVKATSIGVREHLLDLFDALHRELAAVDNAALAQSDSEYRAITLRFASAKVTLEQAHQRAVQTAANLGAAAQFIQSLANLAGSL